MSKKTRQERLEYQLKAAVEKVSAVVMRLYEATSGHRGMDCADHATLGRELLRDFGFDPTIVVGYAAWRVGTADCAAISHVPHELGHLPSGARGFAYHAWLQCNGRIIDLTTYQLTRKARALDDIDGGYTEVTWCPPFLIIPPHRTQTYQQVQRSLRAGVAYYEPRPELVARLEQANTLALAPEDLSAARKLLANPGLGISGANDVIDPRLSAQEQLARLEALMEVLGPENVPNTVQRVAEHLRARPIPLTDDDATHLARLLARAATNDHDT